MKPGPGRVLIADDEPHVRELLRDFLAREGYEVAAVGTGAQALDAVPTFQPDVLPVDMLMPGLSGRDLLDLLRQTGVTVPVILISGGPNVVAEWFFGVDDGRDRGGHRGSSADHECLTIGVGSSSAPPLAFSSSRRSSPRW